MTAQIANHSPSDRSAETRARILAAALQEFSSSGLAGARIDQIAAVAQVNKALLYYYFQSKENLYAATLEMIGGKIRDRSVALLVSAASPGERVLRFALDHFDRIVSQHEFQALLQQEMMRVHKGEFAVLPVIIKQVFEPVHTLYQTVVEEGIASRELIDADWLQIHLSTIGSNVFYFVSAPVFRILLPFEPFDPAVLRARRKSTAEFLGQAIFTDRLHGAEVAARALADTPMPEVNIDRFKSWRNNERKK